MYILLTMISRCIKKKRVVTQVGLNSYLRSEHDLKAVLIGTFQRTEKRDEGRGPFSITTLDHLPHAPLGSNRETQLASLVFRDMERNLGPY